MTEQLNINLTSDISYVSGTVNGGETSFSLTSPGIWTAIVPKAEDGRYEVDITAYNNLGSSTNYHTIIYKLDDLQDLKTNWTSEDFYNAEDLNRVEANIEFIADYLYSIDYPVELGGIVTDRNMMDIDFISSINRVEDNLENIRSKMDIIPPGYGSKKTWTNRMGFNYEDANRYERNLELLYKWAQLICESYRYCGTFICGEEVI